MDVNHKKIFSKMMARLAMATKNVAQNRHM